MKLKDVMKKLSFVSMYKYMTTFLTKNIRIRIDVRIYEGFFSIETIFVIIGLKVMQVQGKPLNFIKYKNHCFIKKYMSIKIINTKIKKSNF